MEACVIHREHILQKHARLWAREALACEHKFMAFDRGQAAGQFSHERERQRGIVRGTPDTLLRVKGLPPIWCEFKRPGNEPTPAQYAMGDDLQALGDYWSWRNSVESYRVLLIACGVRMRPNAEFLALHHDGSVATEIAKAEAKAGAPRAPGKPRAKKLSSAHIRRVTGILRGVGRA